MPVFVTPNNRSRLASYDNSMTIKLSLHEEPMNISRKKEDSSKACPIVQGTSTAVFILLIGCRRQDRIDSSAAFIPACAHVPSKET